MQKSFLFPLYLLSILILGMSISSLQAADLPARGPIPFEAFDKNGDNMISPQEYVETHNLRKKQRAEANMPGGAMMDPGFNFFDENADNLISRQELENGRANWQQNRNAPGMGQGMGMGHNMPSFAEFDLNGDGVLVKEEFYDARAKRMYDRAEKGFPLRNAANAPAFEDVDTNADGKVDPEEFKAHQLQHRQMRNN